MTEFEFLKSKLALTGLYNITENTNIYKELKVYAAAFDKVRQELDDMFRENFISTAETYGIINRERLMYGVQDSKIDITTRRKLLIDTIMQNDNNFKLTDLYRLIEAFSTVYSVFENPAQQRVIADVEMTGYSDAQCRKFADRIQRFMPVHLETQIVYKGNRWQTLDEKNLTWTEFDSANKTWKEFDEQ